jgi:hypothetical protein
MSTTNTGGSAFPVQESSVMNNGERAQYAEPGMTLRDYMATKLMPEVYRQYADQANAKNQWDPDWQMYLAVDAYRLADAMLRAREL